MLSALHSERQATLDAFEWTWGNYNPSNLLLFAAYSDAFNVTMEIVAAIDQQISAEIALIGEQDTTEQPITQLAEAYDRQAIWRALSEEPLPLLRCYLCGEPTMKRCLQCREPICWNNELFGFCLKCWAKRQRRKH